MRQLLAILATMLLSLAAATSVAAAPPEHERFEVNEVITEDLCGVEVVTTLAGSVHVMHRADGLHIEHPRVTITIENAAGDWLTTRGAGPIFATETDNGDGTLTVIARHVGVQSKWRSSEGISAAFDRGTITFVIQIDLNEPGDFDDDEVTSFTWTFHGPHPEADSDFELFCEVIEEVLG